MSSPVLSATVVALAAALVLGAGAMVTAQTGDTPGPAWVEGSKEILWIHQKRSECEWVNRPTPLAQDAAGLNYRFYMHADPDDPCGSDTFTGDPKPLIRDRDPYKIHMQPFATEPIPFVEGSKVNITIHLFHQALTQETSSINYLQAHVNLSQDDAWSASDWAEPASVQQLQEGKEWYEYSFQLDPPAPAISNGSEAFFLKVNVNKCGLFPSETIFEILEKKTACQVETVGYQSVGYTWRIGFEEGHRSFVELPLPDAFKYDEPWPPIVCGEGEELNKTAKKCDPLPPVCVEGELLNQTTNLCEPEKTDEDGQEPNANSTTTTTTAGVQGNDTDDGPDGGFLPGFETVGMLAAVTLAFAVAVRRRRT